MIIGIGIDLIEVDRVQTKISRNEAFKNTVFSREEIDWCEKQTNKGENYAARFAAKEAFLKATGRGLSMGYELSNIEVVNDAIGKPSIRLAGAYKEEAAKCNWNHIHVTLSHLRETACAVVIIEQ
ncbi:holo-ACP synthase [Chryseolinea sp. T2]|uniref:holo-ACP synthase n=1 Tax=Chryseolinea sp. T2 TaxID=3129255 RepID=UPI003077DFA2